MKKHLSSFLVLLTVIMCISELYAVRATPHPITITQNDGSQLTIYLRGNEFFHYKTTLDGYLLTSDTDGILKYAEADEKGNLVNTKIKASSIEKRTTKEKELIKRLKPNINLSNTNRAQKVRRSNSSSTDASAARQNYPLTGSPKSLVILVNFSDVKYITSNPKTAFTNLLNESGYSTNGGTGSARDYFVDNSMGVFNPDFEVVGPYNLPQNMAYYGKNESDGDDANPRQMVIDACTLASNAGVNFAEYDTDNDGYVDNIFVYYAGYNEAEGASDDTIWPHRWALSNNSTTFNGKIISDYACTSELKSRSGSNMCGIGTFVHEFGHVLGLPDYYATNGAEHQTLSYWSVMDAGPYLNAGRTPPSYSAYDRFYLNWLKPTEIKTPGAYTLSTMATSNKAYLITQNGNHNLNGENPSPVEFFTLENRQKKGWDAYLPGHGMLITHIYYNSTIWNNNGPNNDPLAMGVDIVEADRVASDGSLPGDPFPGTSNISYYSPTLRSGIDINKSLTEIKEANEIITFNFMGGKISPAIATTGTFSTFSTVQGDASAVQTIKVSGKYLNSKIQLSFANNKNFDMKKESDDAWGRTITLTPTDSVVESINILFRYNPIAPSFANTHAEIVQIESTDAETISLSLAGKSTRKVYVVAPVATSSTDITIASFVANWKAVSDSIGKLAAGYYLTVYNISDGNTTLKEGFNNGLTAPADWTINASAISTSTVYSGDSIPAIQFSNTGDFIETEKYILPATGMSFHIRSLFGNGSILVEAWNGTTWSDLGSISVFSTLNDTKTFSFGLEKNYSRFRISFIKSSGSVVIDDVAVNLSQKIEYNVLNKWTTSTTETLINLVSNRDYYYKVKASDKKLNSDGSILYENITDFSNLITIRTAEDQSKEKSLIVTINKSGELIIVTPSTDLPIRIYNLVGQLIQIVNPAYNRTIIQGLPRGHVYILKSGTRSSKVIL